MYKTMKLILLFINYIIVSECHRKIDTEVQVLPFGTKIF